MGHVAPDVGSIDVAAELQQVVIINFQRISQGAPRYLTLP